LLFHQQLKRLITSQHYGKGNLQLNPAMLFSIGLVSTFITGGLTGIILGDSTLDINVHDTYFVVLIFHLVMGISALYGMFAGIYHWFPKMFGRMLNKIWICSLLGNCYMCLWSIFSNALYWTRLPDVIIQTQISFI
jgi:heme/copper-type cytochrome/quinol oxidase subunit 1